MKIHLRRFLSFSACLLFTLSFYYGCSSVSKSLDALHACQADAKCFAQMEQGKDLVSAISSSVAGSFPQTAPMSGVVGSSLGMLASLLIGVYLGRKQGKV